MRCPSCNKLQVHRCYLASCKAKFWIGEPKEMSTEPHCICVHCATPLRLIPPSLPLWAYPVAAGVLAFVARQVSLTQKIHYPLTLLFAIVTLFVLSTSYSLVCGNIVRWGSAPLGSKNSVEESDNENTTQGPTDK